MTPDAFKKRLCNKKACNYIYKSGGLEGLVAVWKNEGQVILTWEECPEGQQYDESTYTRDERYVFSGIDDLLAFFDKNGLNANQFSP